MKRMLLLALLALGFFVTGCGVVDTYAQRERRYCYITEYNLREAVDDWDYFWLADRPSYMTYWYLRDTE